MKLEFAGIQIEIVADRKLPLSKLMQSFLSRNTKTDLTVKFTWNWEGIRHPKTPAVGEDLIQEYYHEDEWFFCEAKGGKAPITCTCYKADFSQMICAVNESPFLQPPDTWDQLLRFLPMRAVFQHFDVIFLHASQIVVNGTGILFSAPSGTGKTTQAHLWKKYKGAEIVCGDRTLIRRRHEDWDTFGYPMDGSEPVACPEANRLGCIVLLKQGSENRIARLNGAKAVSLLIEQTIIDCWNEEARVKELELLLELVRRIPVYQFYCKKSKSAVTALYDMLIAEGVLENDSDNKAFMG